MSARARALAAAQGAVGARYRLHGRDPHFGLDCVGLAALAMRAAGYTEAIPSGYALRGRFRGREADRGNGADDVVSVIDSDALVRTDDPMPGDVLLFAVGPAQFHIAIKSERGVFHADAMLRRVVERPGPAPWPLVAAWRLVDLDAAQAMIAGR